MAAQNKNTSTISRFYMPVVMLMLIFITLSVDVFGQQQCTQKLKAAEQAYDEGRIENIPEMLAGCIDRGFTREEKIRAYKLVINAHLFNQDLNQASQKMLEFLRFNPEYVPNKNNEPAEFLSLYKKFETLPYLSLGVYGGINFSNIAVIKPYTISSTSKTTYEHHAPGFQFGLKFSKPVYKNIELNAEPGFLRHTFRYTEESLDFSKLTITENQDQIFLPISGSFVYPIKQWHPFISLGLSAEYLINATATPERTYAQNTQQPVSGTDIELTDMRQKFNISLFAEIGLKYKIPRGYFFLSGRYYHGLMNQVNEDKRYSNAELNYIYYYIDDDRRLNNYAISVGYMYMLYKPKRKK
ncbi:hypothetical protein L21SP5_02541 [Salinivirga cyanobacteriivorans]|uniref:Outer membrane protein beta-barrel domain-containing protein n=1 Tax=Salinivirga cyanobacteriivorans TaxID=1307839 RepID=A0A0S2I1U8_9BACT|nr:porin family protein [Salinivirga cyanobacteriivorans]ALO16165.1 hypothetical protein L21SP5_02541 [Salinivirga cyanobacteriivorans]